MQKLVFCLDELIRTILRYRSPQDINLPYRLCQRSPFIAISPAGYASSTAALPNPAMMPPPMYTTGPSPYYASAPAVPKPMDTGYPESVCSSIPSLDSNASCESGQERSVLQESVFSRAEQNKQKDNQMQFLDQLEEEERKGKEAAKKEKERLEVDSNKRSVLGFLEHLGALELECEIDEGDFMNLNTLEELELLNKTLEQELSDGS